MSPWGKRKLSDDTIRKISNRIKEIPKGTRAAAYKVVAMEFHCSVATIYRIQAGTLTPNNVVKPCQS